MIRNGTHKVISKFVFIKHYNFLAVRKVKKIDRNENIKPFP